jgi:hypothetical protein
MKKIRLSKKPTPPKKVNREHKIGITKEEYLKSRKKKKGGCGCSRKSKKGSK